MGPVIRPFNGAKADSGGPRDHLFVILIVAAVLGLVTDARADDRDLFAPLGEVFRHPRCVNCHVMDDVPRQGDTARPHAQGVRGGPMGEGMPGLPCRACHGQANAITGDVPGAPKWRLPPVTMGWTGLTDGAICRAVTDPATNGGHSVEVMGQHLEHDPLVRWGFEPGGNRAPVPLRYEPFVEAVRAWVAAGGPCPVP